MSGSPLADAGSGVEVIRSYAATLDELASRISDEDLRAVVSRLVACQGRLVTVGVGKSGLVAQRIAALFNSVGFSAQFMNPLDAIHGDLGIIKAQDVVIAVSNSGDTPELVGVAPILKTRASCMIGIVSTASCEVARLCDHLLVFGRLAEVDPLGVVPTTSALAASTLGDALVVMWMRATKVKPATFAANHPAGELGRRLSLRVADVMIVRAMCPPVSPEDELGKVLKMISQGGAGAVWVEDPDGRLVGIVTDGDVRRALQAHLGEPSIDVRARDVMTSDPIVIESNELAIRAMEVMEKNRRKPVSILPVIADERVVGLIRLHSLVQVGLS
jgi:arabinose-5-phosphate isomerase